MSENIPSPNQFFDVAICGTGPAGMIASLQAAARGLNVVQVGPAINTQDKRTTALLTPSLDALGDLGLGEAIASIGTPLMVMRLVDGSRRLLRAPTVSFDAEEIGRSQFGLNCPNSLLNQILLDAVHATSITRLEGTVVDYALGGSPLVLTLSDGIMVETEAVIAADGKKSPAREAAGIKARSWTYDQTAAVGVVQHAKPHDYVSTEFHTETGPFTFVPMPDSEDGSYRSSFVCALSPEDADALANMDLDAASLFLERRSQHLFGVLNLEAPVQLWQLTALVANGFAAQGIYLTGEAAHAFPPIGAQGLNLSIRDGADAVDVIAVGIEAGEDLTGRLLAARYSAKRRADVWTRTLGVDALNKSLLSKNPLMQVGRAAALTAAKFVPPFKKGLMVAGLEPLGMQAVVDALKISVRPS